KDYERNIKIPAEEYSEYVILSSKAETIWEEAKENDDFELFRPYLEKLVEFNQRFVEYWGYEENKYDTLLDMYEPGVTVKVIDRVFKQLREH
ncbi:carboxypeptidase M32, partial [Planococcus sp. SIMBA_143]